MKWLIASDIHGSALFCEQLLAAYRREKASRLILLGDVLYHGPRNDLPDGYNPKEVIEMLNGIKDDILCVRGNCDTEVDQMVLQFPILADYALLAVPEYTIFATHGHRYSGANPPPLHEGDILLCGHTHIPACEDHGRFFCLNPGSVSIPKEDSPHGYMILQNGQFSWKTLDGQQWKAWSRA